MDKEHLLKVRKNIALMKEGFIRPFFVFSDQGDLTLHIAERKGTTANYKTLAAITALMNKAEWTPPSEKAKFGYGYVVERDEQLLFFLESAKGVGFNTIKKFFIENKVALGFNGIIGIATQKELKNPAVESEDGHADEKEGVHVRDTMALLRLKRFAESIVAKVQTATDAELKDARKALWDYQKQDGPSDVSAALQSLKTEQARRALQEDTLDNWEKKAHEFETVVSELSEVFYSRTLKSDDRIEFIKVIEKTLNSLRELESEVRILA
jgi:hypothetical protein